MNLLATKRILLRYGPAAAMIAVISVLSLLPAHCFRGVESALPPIHGLDKIVHALLYAALTATCLHGVPPAKRLLRPRTVLTIAFTATLYGALMEICQKELTTTRCMDPFDALANAVGAFTCAFAAYAWTRYVMSRTSKSQNPLNP